MIIKLLGVGPVWLSPIEYVAILQDFIFGSAPRIGTVVVTNVKLLISHATMPAEKNERIDSRAGTS
jgi:hypothetical protein